MKNSKDELNDIFNLSVDSFFEEQKLTSANERFKPDPAKGKENVYKAVIRFLPWYKDPKKSIMKKWNCWLTNPVTNESLSVDCPTTIGEKSIIYDTFWKLKNSKSAREQELSNFFSRRQKFASLVQIIKDDNNPENNGKILVWEYGVKIKNKIDAELKPEDSFTKPCNPFDLFEGKPFFVHVTIVSSYNNYDNCRFLEAMPITIDGKKMQKTPEDMEKIREYLKTSPDLSKYDFQPWTPEIKEFVNEAVNAALGNKTEEKEKPATMVATKKSEPKEQKIDFDINDEDLYADL